MTAWNLRWSSSIWHHPTLPWLRCACLGTQLGNLVEDSSFSDDVNSISISSDGNIHQEMVTR